MTALPRPLKASGKRGARWVTWQKKQRAIVMSRCRGMCEQPYCKRPATDWHHIWNRRQLSEPLASHHTQTVGLCRRCHHEVTNYPSDINANRLRHAALERAEAEWPVHLGTNWMIRYETLIEASHELERTLKADAETWQSLLDEAGV